MVLLLLRLKALVALEVVGLSVILASLASALSSHQHPSLFTASPKAIG